MNINVSSVTSHFTNPQDGFTTTTSGSVSSGAATVGLNSTGDYSNGDIVVLIIDPADSDKKQVFVGTIDTSGVQVTGVVWVGGTNQAHSAGATVVDYYDAAHVKMMTKGILVHADQDGTLKAGAVDVSAVLADSVVSTAKLADSAVTHTKVAAGAVVQVVDTVSSALAPGTTTVPNDDTPPTSSEGTEFMTLSITPKSTTNKLVIEASALVACSNVNNVIGALFQDSGTDSIATDIIRIYVGDGTARVIIRHTMTAGTTSATTFKLRMGPQAAGTITFNGSAGVRVFSTTTKSSMVITEYKV